jgi:hypothetical protein
MAVNKSKNNQNKPKETKHTHKRTKSTKKATPIQAKILKIKEQHPDLSTHKIAGLVPCHHTSVIKCLTKYHIDAKGLESYKQHRGDIVAGVGERIIKSVTDDDIKRMPIGQRIMSYGILYDKERLERGQATSITDDMSSMIDRIEQRYAKAIDVTPIPDKTNNNQ